MIEMILMQHRIFAQIQVELKPKSCDRSNRREFKRENVGRRLKR